METPLGLRYTPFFPIAQSIYRQAEQRHQLRVKKLEEAKKTAEGKAYDAANMLLKQDLAHPYINSLEPYFQNLAKTQLDISTKVRNGELPAQAAYEHMAVTQDAINRAKNYDTVTTTNIKRWEASGNRDMKYITQLYGNDTADLTSTSINGKVTWLPPNLTSATTFVAKAENSIDSFLPEVLAQKYIAALEKTELSDKEKYDPATSVINKTTQLPEPFFLPIPGTAGQSVLNINVGDEGTEMSSMMLRRYRALGDDWENYLKLRAAKENPEFVNMTPESDEWGLQMQKSLQNFMSERGFIGKKKGQDALKPNEVNDDGSSLSTSGKRQASAREGVDFVHRVISKDPRALAFFAGPNIESVAYTESGKLMITPRQGREAAVNALADGVDGSEVDKKTGVVLIPASRNGIGAIINLYNAGAQGQGAKFNALDVETTYPTIHPEGKRGTSAKAKPEDVAAKEQKKTLAEKLTPESDIVDVSDAPSQDDIDAFILGADVGTVIKLKDGKTLMISPEEKKKVADKRKKK